MRRFPAILLLVLFLLPTAAPLLALSRDPDASLPACCRRNGIHHCSMSPEQMQSMMQMLQSGTRASIVPMKCPCYPRALVTAQHNDAIAHAAAFHFAAVVAHPAIHAQTLARARVSLFCARQKRGPPSLLSYT